MSQLKHTSLFLFLVLALSYCKEPYQFTTSAKNGLLVVDGSISDLDGPYLLTLGTTNDKNLPTKLPIPELGATAFLTDDQGTIEYYVEKGNGVYQLSGNTLHGKPGRSYTLSVSLFDGRTFQSTAEIMPTSAKPIDSVFAKAVRERLVENGVEVNNWYVNVFFNTEFQQKGESYFRWQVSEAYSLFPYCAPGSISCPKICIVYEPYSSYTLNVISRNDYSGSSIKNIFLMKRAVDYVFNTRHYFNVTQYGMNAAAFNYWKGVQKLISNTGTIFSTPPYTIKGNVRNTNNPNELVLGYFEASTQRLTRKYIDRGEIPTFVQSCVYGSPDFLLGFNFCYDCTLLPGSTQVIPDWFF